MEFSRKYIVYEDTEIEIYKDREFTCTNIGAMDITIEGHKTEVPIQLGFNNEPMTTFYHKGEKYTAKPPWQKFRQIATRAITEFIEKTDSENGEALEGVKKILEEEKL